MHVVAKSCSKQAFRRLVSSAKSTSRSFSSFVTSRQSGGLLAASTSTRTYVPALMKQFRVTVVFQRWYSVPQLQENVSILSSAEYHALSDETMETLLGVLEVLVDSGPDPNFEVEYSSGVLTLNLGEHGTYVVNKQPPNKQIWLSSPLSGPKRYDFDPESGTWTYSRDKTSLGQLLEEELSKPFGEPVKLGLEPEKFNPLPPKADSKPSSSVPEAESSTGSQEVAEKPKSG